MNTTMQISRDTEGLRVEMEHDAGRILAARGRWMMEFTGDEFFIHQDEGGISVCNFRSCGKPGLRFQDFAAGFGQGVKLGRFGPVQVEVDISNGGFGAELPNLHERPWPTLRFNDGCYPVQDQMMLTLAERVNDLIDFSGMPEGAAIKWMQRRIPDDQRRYMPRGKNTRDILLAEMARLRLPSGSA